VWTELIRNLERRDLLPMVVFAFSKRRCDTMVDSLTGLDLTGGAEKHEIHVFCERCLSRLSPPDRKLPQVLRVRELLRRGLGVHHAGLLPIVKEIVEMLFCRGLLKVLFSTETFAMGVNAPARSVCFQDLRKHDGSEFRGILPGEYTQMAGRAGRRGLDPVGTVIIAAWDNFPTESVVRNLLAGKATKLQSQFRLTFGMILNLMRVEDLRVEDMLARSFAEFHAQRGVMDKRAGLALDVAALKRVNHLAAEEEASDIVGWAAAEAHEHASAAVRHAAAEVRAAVLTSKGGIAAMTAGRVLLIAGGGGDIDKHGALLRIVSTSTAGARGAVASEEAAGKTYVVLVPCPEGHPALTDEEKAEEAAAARAEEEEERKPSEPMMMIRKGKRDDDDDDDDVFGGYGKKGGKRGGGGSEDARIEGPMPPSLPWRLSSAGMDYLVRAVPFDSVLAITEAKIPVEQGALLEAPTDGSSPTPAAAAAAARALSALEKTLSNGSPAALHPVKDLKLADVAAVELCHEHSRLVSRLPPLPPSVAPRLRAWHALLDARRELQKRVDDAEYNLSDANLQQMPDFETRVQVLQTMGYLDEDRTVTLKGRVACEIATGDELVGTEIIFDGVLRDLPPEEAVAVLAALVFQEKNASAPELHGSLLEACERSKELAFLAGEEQLKKGLAIAPDEYVTTTLRFGLTEVVNEWAKGTLFSDICTITDVQEGSIVRTIVRLDEMCRDVRNAARIMGDSALYEKMEQASAAIKRDIVFSASLYVAGA
jgi:antiviral helicase SKI2